MADRSIADGHCPKCGAHAKVAVELGTQGTVKFYFHIKNCTCEADPWGAYYAWPGTPERSQNQ